MILRTVDRMKGAVRTRIAVHPDTIRRAEPVDVASHETPLTRVTLVDGFTFDYPGTLEQFSDAIDESWLSR